MTAPAEPTWNGQSCPGCASHDRGTRLATFGGGCRDPWHPAPVKLANESALGVYSFSWMMMDGTKLTIQWGEGMTVPMAFYGPAAMREVTRPERFGWDGPPKGSSRAQLAAVKAFAQRFADALAAECQEDQ
jgi:hypothetical protein